MVDATAEFTEGVVHTFSLTGDVTMTDMVKSYIHVTDGRLWL